MRRLSTREQVLRQEHTVPAHETALFHGALLQIAKKDEEIERLRGALEEIVRDKNLPVQAYAIAVGALLTIRDDS